MIKMMSFTCQASSWKCCFDMKHHNVHTILLTVISLHRIICADKHWSESADQSDGSLHLLFYQRSVAILGPGIMNRTLESAIVVVACRTKIVVGMVITVHHSLRFQRHFVLPVYMFCFPNFALWNLFPDLYIFRHPKCSCLLNKWQNTVKYCLFWLKTCSNKAQGDCVSQKRAVNKLAGHLSTSVLINDVPASC